jgi:hypothetical protein
LQVSGATISGAETDILTITGVTVADEGDYHCIASKATYPDAVSTAAQLLTKRLISHWPLDSDLTDIEGGWDGELPAGNSTSFDTVDQMIGVGALDFGSASDPNNHVTITGSEDYFNFYTRGFTATFWIKAPAEGVSAGVFEKFDGTGFTNYRVGLVTSAYLDGSSVASSLTADQWDFFAATYDADTNTMVHYLNGLEVGRVESVVTSTGSTVPVLIGAPGAGVIDDVKMYSYARSEIEVAQEYATAAGVPLCVTRPALDIAPVGALDCKVNILDFAEFASTWLEDGNVYP